MPRENHRRKLQSKPRSIELSAVRDSSTYKSQHPSFLRFGSHDKNLPLRIPELRKIFSSGKIDGLIFFNMSNIRYLSGFTGSEGILFIDAGRPTLFVDGRYTVQAGLETRGIKIIECPDKIEAVIRVMRECKLKHIGFEADSLTWNIYDQMVRRFPKGRFIALSNELRMLRARKDEAEIELMKKAARISSSAIRSIISRIKPGWKEKEVAWQLEIEARNNGADGVAFETIVAANENSALPHAKPTERKIKKGDFLVIDFGIKYNGYCSDETCTIAFGKLTDRQKNAYQIVKDAHDRALEMLTADIPAADVDKQVRKVFGKKYERYFTHSTGHGVGLEVHEAPRLSSVSGDILKPGMVFTIEPGLYIPGLWGIRIEDTVLLKENSCEKLTKMDKELIIIE